MNAILVTGSSGNVGSAVLDHLREAGVAWRAGVSGAVGQTDAGAENVVVCCDLRDRVRLRRALSDIDRVYMMIPFHRDMLNWGRIFVETATECGVRFIVRLSALGAAPNSPSAMGRLHGEIDGYVRESGIDFCIVRCNSFMQNFSGHYAGMLRRGRLCVAQGDARFSFVDTRDIARIIADVILAPEKFAGRTLDLHGPQCLSNGEAVELIGSAIGKRLQYVPLTEEQQARQFSRAGIGAWEQAVLESLDQCFRAGFAVGDPAVLEQLLGRGARRFAAFAQDYRHRWL